MKHINRKLQQKVNHLKYRIERARANKRNALRNYWDASQKERMNPLDRFNEITNKLTNWQRSQWAKAGYPGLRHPSDAGNIEPFTQLSR